jgi:glycosyltransferase involved in cell wall biosynthesis
MPKVSVIIPVFNADEFLKECIESVRSQTLNDIEIICVDDGSTDTSVGVLNLYKDNDNRIQVFRQDHKYAGAARNLGLDHAMGDYVIFIDADDFYPNSDALKVLYDHAMENNVDICGGSRVHLRDGKIVKPIWNEKEFFTKNELVRFMDYQFDFNHQRYLFKRAFLIENNLKYRDYARFQDAPFLLEAMICAKSFYAVKHDVYCYRRGHKNTHWDARAVNDWLRGLTENLIRSRNEGLSELHDRVAQRIFNSDYIKIIARSVSERNQDAMYLLDHFIKNIDLGMSRFKRYNNMDELRRDYMNMLKEETAYVINSAPKTGAKSLFYYMKKHIRKCLGSERSFKKWMRRG